MAAPIARSERSADAWENSPRIVRSHGSPRRRSGRRTTSGRTGCTWSPGQGPSHVPGIRAEHTLAVVALIGRLDAALDLRDRWLAGTPSPAEHIMMSSKRTGLRRTAATPPATMRLWRPRRLVRVVQRLLHGYPKSRASHGPNLLLTGNGNRCHALTNKPYLRLVGLMLGTDFAWWRW